MEKKIVYIAIPFSHTSEEVEKERYDIVTKLAALMCKDGEIVFSPITHSYPLQQVSDLPNNWDYWGKHDRAFLEMSKKLVVVMAPGWEESKGVQAEIQIAKELEIPTAYYSIEKQYKFSLEKSLCFEDIPF